MLDCIKEDMEAVGASPEDTQGRKRWRRLVHMAAERRRKVIRCYATYDITGLPIADHFLLWQPKSRFFFVVPLIAGKQCA